MEFAHIFVWCNFTFLVISETLKQRDGFWYITGRGCGITTPIKYLSEIPEDIENYGCSIIRPMVQPMGNVNDLEEQNAMSMKVMITSGVPHNIGLKTEIIDLNNPDFKCSLQDFPRELYGAVGGFVNRKPLVCSGYKGGISVFDDCYAYQNNDWALPKLTHIPQMALNLLT